MINNILELMNLTTFHTLFSNESIHKTLSLKMEINSAISYNVREFKIILVVDGAVSLDVNVSERP